MVRIGGIDLLLSGDGDLVITPDGDTRLAVGITNIVQKVRLALGTPQGSLLHHPSYGLPIVAGASTADVNAKGLSQAIKSMFNDDPSFTGVTSITVNKAGPTAAIGMNVGVSGINRIIPVNVKLAR
jgi:hypothetical protein